MEQNVNEILDGRYRIEQFMGSGGTADVYKAFDLQKKMYVAIKMFKKELMNDEKAKSQFMHENQVLAIIDNHKNIISVYEIAVKEEHIYIVMELAAGETLSHYINYHGGRIPLSDAVGFSCQILEALSYIHSKGVVHRDIKSKNIIILEGKLVKVTDFGIASIPGLEDQETDNIRGTALYMSPEQIKGDTTDARTDIYSVGIVMYEMLTGHLPFTSSKENPDDRNGEIFLKHLRETPVKPSSYDPNLPSALEQIVLKAMSKLPSNRFQSCDEMLKYIKIYINDNNVIFDFELQQDVYDEYAALFPETSPEHFVPEPLKKISGAQASAGAKEKTEKQLSGFMGLSVLAVFVIFISVFFIVFGEIVFSGRGQRTVITIGELVNSRFSDELVEQLEEKGYDVSVEYEYSDTYPEGTVIAQKPAASYAQVLSDGENPSLTLVVSGGFRMMMMNDYSGRQFTDVKYELESAGFDVTVEKQASDSFAEGQIISTSPQPGEIASQNEAIILYVSIGKDAAYVYVPNVVGLTYAVAVDRLSRMGISVLPAVYEYSDDYPAGTVIYQNVAYGERMSSEFSKMELTVSLGSK